ncbi:putative glycosyltransferase [compost metagenome]
MQLSIVTTLYRSAPHLRAFYERARAAAETSGFSWEIVMVNDGSPDESAAIASSLVEEDPRVVLVDLSRNFGHHKAMMTGLAHARGELVFLIDSDLEEDPAWLERFHQTLLDTQADVVYGVQEAARKGNAFERLSGDAYYAVVNWLSSAPIPRNLVTTRLMTRRYVQALVQHQERELMIAGLWVITGFKQVALPVKKLSLTPTTYTLGRKLTLLVDAVTAFSNKPLIMIFYLGLAITALSLVAAVVLVTRVLFFQALLPGWASLIVSVWLLGGITIFCLGLIGIYLSKIYIETKQRPYTIVRAVHRHHAEPGVPTPGGGTRSRPHE